MHQLPTGRSGRFPSKGFALTHKNDFKTLRKSRPDFGPQTEILVSKIYRALVSEGHFVVDGGANTGLHCLPLSKLVGPSGRVHAFEPNPPIMAQLKKNIGARDWVVFHQLALSNKVGEVSFVVDEENPALSHIYSPIVGDKPTLQVQTTTLDIAVTARPVTFIKLDLEHADFLAMMGASDILSNDRPIVTLENGRSWSAKCHGYSEADFFGHLEKIGYEVFDLHGVQITPETWSSDGLGFECVAGHKADPRLRTVLRMAADFWNSIDQRPVLTQWSACAAIVSNGE